MSWQAHKTCIPVLQMCSKEPKNPVVSPASCLPEHNALTGVTYRRVTSVLNPVPLLDCLVISEWLCCQEIYQFCLFDGFICGEYKVL